MGLPAHVLHGLPMSSRARPVDVVSAGASLGIGLATWVVTMASAPRHSASDTGEPFLYFAALTALAAVAGAALPRSGVSAAARLGLPGLVLSPWTAPRGDDDGLWILIVPMLFGFVVALAIVAMGTARTRRRMRASAT